MADQSSLEAGIERVNQLGGTYVNGKPIPKEVRQQIVALARRGVRPCDISRGLRITHGCISKLLARLRKTGSLDSGGEHIGRPRVITPYMAQKIEQYRRQQPKMFSWEIRDRLLQEDVCRADSLPSITSISRLLRQIEGREKQRTRMQSCASTSYMIASILNLQSASESMNKDNAVGETEGVAYNATESHDQALAMDEPRPQRRERMRYTSQQTDRLEAVFRNNQYPTTEDRDHLAQEIGVDKERIQIWFSNQRAKRKRRIFLDNTEARAGQS